MDLLERETPELQFIFYPYIVFERPTLAPFAPFEPTFILYSYSTLENLAKHPQITLSSLFSFFSYYIYSRFFELNNVEINFFCLFEKRRIEGESCGSNDKHFSFKQYICSRDKQRYVVIFGIYGLGSVLHQTFAGKRVRPDFLQKEKAQPAHSYPYMVLLLFISALKTQNHEEEISELEKKDPISYLNTHLIKTWSCGREEVQNQDFQPE